MAEVFPASTGQFLQACARSSLTVALTTHGGCKRATGPAQLLFRLLGCVLVTCCCRVIVLAALVHRMLQMILWCPHRPTLLGFWPWGGGEFGWPVVHICLPC
jgi:hypothetical protein